MNTNLVCLLDLPITDALKSCSKAAWCTDIVINFSQIPCTIPSTMRTVKNVFVVPSIRHRGVSQHLSTLMPQSTESRII